MKQYDVFWKDREKERNSRKNEGKNEREGEKKRINPKWKSVKGTRLVLNDIWMYHKTTQKQKQQYRKFRMWLVILPFVWYNH